MFTVQRKTKAGWRKVPNSESYTWGTAQARARKADNVARKIQTGDEYRVWSVSEKRAA